MGRHCRSYAGCVMPFAAGTLAGADAIMNPLNIRTAAINSLIGSRPPKNRRVSVPAAAMVSAPRAISKIAHHPAGRRLLATVLYRGEDGAADQEDRAVDVEERRQQGAPERRAAGCSCTDH